MIDSITSTSANGVTTGSTLGGSQQSKMGKDEFLRLLVTQLANQDPMNPLQGHEFAAQLAQFTSVEQLTNIEAALGQASEMNGLVAANVNNGVAAGLIGKDVEAFGSTIGLASDGSVQYNLDFEAAANDATVSIRDASGKIVRTIDLGAAGKGNRALNWDGKNDDGARMPEGQYTIEVEAKDRAGDRVGVQTYINGKVDRVTFGPEGIQLWLGPTAVSMAAVRSVRQEG